MKSAILFSLAGVFFLAGCAGVLTPPPAPVRDYHVEGKIVARPDEGAARAVSFEWLRLRVPAGTVDSVTFRRHGVSVARMTISPEGIHASTARGEVLQGEDIPAKRLGIPVPLRALGFWLAGKSDPSSSSRETTLPGGAIQSIHQHGWKVVFAERDEEGRPMRIEAEFPGGTAEVEVRPKSASADAE